MSQIFKLSQLGVLVTRQKEHKGRAREMKTTQKEKKKSNKVIGLKSIYVRFVLNFIGILWLSSMIAFFVVSSVLPGVLYQPLTDFMTHKAEELINLNETYDIPASEAVKLANSGFISVKTFNKIEEVQAEGIAAEALKQLTSGQTIALGEKEIASKHGIFVVAKVGTEWVLIKPYFDNAFFQLIGKVTRSVLLLSAIIGSILILFSVKQIVKPIKRLTAATQKVATGDFDFVVSTNLKDELGQLVSNFNIMTDELKQIEYLRKDFVSSVSHEFKTPIASIGGFAKLLRDKDHTEYEQREYLEIIIMETERLSKLAGNLLRLSSIEHQVIVERNSHFYLDEQIRMTLLILENEWHMKNLELDLQMDEVEFHGDEELIQQIWINLLSNAIKFSNDNGYLQVVLQSHEEYVQVTIKDEGSGMSEAVQSRIFEKFYQGDSAHKTEGNGLGLPIVKRIVELCGGTIEMASEERKGTVVTVVLPVR